MKLSPAFTTVTPFSKMAALILFITLPIVGFMLGKHYSSLIDQKDQRVVSIQQLPTPNLTFIYTPMSTVFDQIITQSPEADSALSNVLVTISTSGGLCPQNYPCGSTNHILRDGSAGNVNGVNAISVNASDITKLAALVNSTNYAEIKSKKFTGTCPTAFDGQATTYTFYTSHGKEILHSCTYELDMKLPLFEMVNNIHYK